VRTAVYFASTGEEVCRKPNVRCFHAVALAIFNTIDQLHQLTHITKSWFGDAGREKDAGQTYHEERNRFALDTELPRAR
jgi:hypothetical protein